jgi:hypothetical protein
MWRRRTSRVGSRSLADYVDFRRLPGALVGGAVIVPLALYVKWPEAVEVLIAFAAAMATYLLLGRRKRR